MPRPSNTQTRRAQITTAFLQVLATRGYDGASIGEIARAAQLSPGLVHYHFASKEEILIAAVDELVGRHERRLGERLGVASTARQRVEVWVRSHLGLGPDRDPEGAACWVLMTGEAMRTPEVRVRLAAAFARSAAGLSEVVAAGVAGGELRCGDARAAASALVAVVQGYLVVAAVDRALVPPGTAAVSVLRMAAGLLNPVQPWVPQTDAPEEVSNV